MDKQKIYDILTDTCAEHKHAGHALEKAGLSEIPEADRRWKRLHEWYAEQMSIIRDIVEEHNPEEKR